MFSFSKKVKGKQLLLKIDGMHCVSCAMTIDGALEDLDGVIESSTNYAKQTTKVVFDHERVVPDQIIDEIKKLDYSVSIMTA